MLQRLTPHTEARPAVLAVTPDRGFAEDLHKALSETDIDLTVHPESVDLAAGKLPARRAAALILDIDEAGEAGLSALQRLVAGAPTAACIVVTSKLDEALARALLKAKIRDVLLKPVLPDRLAEACARALGDTADHQQVEADIVTFLPATGGVGSTTLAIHAALLLQERAGRHESTCLVDLDLQQGVCAEYLDLEPRLDLDEIEPQPERLDRQLLEVMLSRHSSGLSVVAAPARPGHRVQAHAQSISRLLDLVAANFSNVVIDLPRHWFDWTDSVLMGSNRLFVVAEMTVPALRQARRLAQGLEERLAQGPTPRIVVNRFEGRSFGSGLRRSDLDQALGGYLAGTVANKYTLVREAIDQGVPLGDIKSKNAVLDDIARLVLPPELATPSRGLLPLLGRLLAR